MHESGWMRRNCECTLPLKLRLRYELVFINGKNVYQHKQTNMKKILTKNIITVGEIENSSKALSFCEGGNLIVALCSSYE